MSVLSGNSINLLLFHQSYCWGLPAVIVFINKINLVIYEACLKNIAADTTDLALSVSSLKTSINQKAALNLTKRFDKLLTL